MEILNENETKWKTDFEFNLLLKVNVHRLISHAIKRFGSSFIL